MTTYLLCPNKDCKLFYDTSRGCPCENDCPNVEDLVKIIKCNNCDEIIELPGNHNLAYRVDCKCGASSFTRMNGTYILIYDKENIQND